MIQLLLLPAALLIALIFGIPLLRYLWLSFHADSVITSLVAIPNNGANWFRLFNDQRFWQDTYQTARFAFVSVSLEIFLALGIALLLDQHWRGRGVVRAITLLPWALPTTVMALGWRWIFNTPNGPIEQFAKLIGLQHLYGLQDLNILANPSLTWLATVVGDVWKTTPFVALILLAGLQTIPNDLYEAFDLEGGKPCAGLFKITLPLLQPYLLLGLLFRLAQAFGVFDLIQVMTGGGPASSTESLALYAYLNAMRFLDFGYSATVMIASFLLLVFICLFGWLVIHQTKHFREVVK
ncbi:MAG: carbohydrate ABC transporter permease [Prochlorococcus sp.]